MAKLKMALFPLKKSSPSSHEFMQIFTRNTHYTHINTANHRNSKKSSEDVYTHM